jgi:hypothetical protein
VNVEAIIDEQFDEAKVTRGFRVANPYGQKASETVQRWDRSAMRNEEVCAIRFIFHKQSFQQAEISVVYGKSFLPGV